MNEKERIRIGNDVLLNWAVVRRQYDPDGNITSVPYSLDGKDLRVTMKVGTVEIPVYDFTVTGTERNVISFTYYGRDQKHLGTYALILTENAGKPGMLTIDRCEAFCLVSRSCEEKEGCTPRVHVHSVKLVSLFEANQVVGKSAYQEWLDAGNAGTEEDFLASLRGKSAYDLALQQGFSGSLEDWLAAGGGVTGEQVAMLMKPIEDRVDDIEEALNEDDTLTYDEIKSNFQLKILE